jgi:hypothetical protein
VASGFSRIADDMVVRQDETVGREHYAGAAAAPAFDTHDGGTGPIDGVNHGGGVGVEEISIVSVTESLVAGHSVIVAGRPGARIA